MERSCFTSLRLLEIVVLYFVFQFQFVGTSSQKALVRGYGPRRDWDCDDDDSRRWKDDCEDKDDDDDEEK
jgi:hypothetical protein